MSSMKQCLCLIMWSFALVLTRRRIRAFSAWQANPFHRTLHTITSTTGSSSSPSIPSSGLAKINPQLPAVTTPVTTATLSLPPAPAPAPEAPKKFANHPFDYHQELTVRIESLTNMGWGIARVELDQEQNSDKPWVVMVPHVCVGELVKVRIFRNQKKFSEADLVQVLEPSADRVEPVCKLAGICGGCQYQHMSITAQRDWKTQHVWEVLLQQQIEGYDTIERLEPLTIPTVGTDHVFGYRSKLTPHYQAPTEINDDVYELQEIGFQQSSKRQLVDVEQCPIATDAINDKYAQVRHELHQQAKEGLLNSKKNPQKRRKKRKRGSRGGDKGATLLFRHADDDEKGNPVVVTDNNEYMTTTVKGIQYRYLAGNFFQNNNYVLPLMVDAVVQAACQPILASDGTTTKPNYLIDCYCGSGLFALQVAASMKSVIGIEVNERAIEEATANAQLNHITNAQFVAASAEAIFTAALNSNNATSEYETVSDLPSDETVVVVDPPRKGCSDEFLQQLYEFAPQRIVYMSCGPATQARDAKGIIEVGGYTITSIQPFDLFPQTKHIESLIVFEKKMEST